MVEATGRHPFVAPGLDAGGYQRFHLPDDRCARLRDGLLGVTWDDTQVGIENGIVEADLAATDPLVYGRNPIAELERMPLEEVFDGRFIVTGLRVPEIVHASLLVMMCTHAKQCMDNGWAGRLKPTTHFLEARKAGHSVHHHELSALALTKITHPTAIGEIYTDGRNIVFYWLSGYLCRTSAAAERVRAVL